MNSPLTRPVTRALAAAVVVVESLVLPNAVFADAIPLVETTDYMHARYYSPNLGRFVSVDPVGGSVGSSQSWNRYSYVLNNPVNMVDPTGRIALADDAVIGGVILAGLTIAYLNAPAANDPTRTNGQVIVDSSIEAVQGLGNLFSNAVGGPYSGLTDDQLSRASDSYDKLIREHQQKLEDYLADPDAHDNKGLLEDADGDLREQIIEGRVRSLEKQLEKQQRELEKIREEQAEREEENKNEADE